MNALYIKLKYLIVDMVAAKYVGELVHGFKLPASIHITIWFVMDCSVQWDIEVDTLRVLNGLVNNYGWHESLPIIWGKDN